MSDLLTPEDLRGLAEQRVQQAKEQLRQLKANKQSEELELATQEYEAYTTPTYCYLCNELIGTDKGEIPHTYIRRIFSKEPSIPTSSNKGLYHSTNRRKKRHRYPKFLGLKVITVCDRCYYLH